MKKTSPIILIVFLTLSTVTLCRAQDTTQSVQSHELGIDVSPLFAGNSGNSIPGVVYRRHYEKGAFRARLSFSGSNYRQTNTVTGANGNSNSFSAPNNYFGVTVRSGYQWNRNWGKYRLYYGLDALFSQSQSHSHGSNINNSSPTTVYINEQEQKYSNTGWGVVPFTGVTYRLNPRLSLSVEAGLNVAFYNNTYEYTTNNYVQNDPNNPSTSGINTSKTESHGFNYYYLPPPNPLESD